MAEERLKCITPGCENTIQPATAKRTGGYCGPCHGKIVKAKRDEYIRQNRRDVDLYAGITDPVEMIRISLERREYDPLIHYLPCPRKLDELFLSLKLPQAERLMTMAAQALRNGNKDFAKNVAQSLAAFTDFNLDQMLETWMELNEFWPPIIFRAAGAKIRSRVIQALHDEQVRANRALQAAAWIGGDEVIKTLNDFDAKPPVWTSSLCISPSAYARTAGWEIVSGRRRELSLERCYAVVPRTPDDKNTDAAIFEERADKCPWCKNSLVNLIHIDSGSAPFSAMGLSGPYFQVVTCHQCGCFENIFGELDAEGRGHWAQVNVCPRFVTEEGIRSPWSGVPVRLSARRATHAADQFLTTDLSQIGGLPAWIQDVAYPNCYKCGKTTIFIAQIDEGHFRGYEGVFYAFLCRDCRVTATTYQQT